jgi:glycosyltransferase involved in cell wall biosynthesis
MKIIFYLRSVGLGKNGGSTTLIKSGNALVELGHEVYFIDRGRNMNTWVPLKAEHIRGKIPDADAIIATGYKSVPHTISAPARCGIKMHWIRGYETWQMPEPQIVEKIFKAPTIKLVNSIGLQRKLKKCGSDSYLVRPGYDLEELYPTGFRDRKHDTIVLGGLFHNKHRVIKRVAWLFDAYRELKKQGYKVELHLMGAEKSSLLKDVKYIRQPDIKQKLDFYNSIDIWLATAMQEGLHMPPAEAMLTECPVVSTKAELSGTQDYITDGVTGLAANNNLDSFINNIKWLCKNQKIREGLGKLGRKRILEIGDRQYNMQKLVDLIEGIKNGNI